MEYGVKAIKGDYQCHRGLFACVTSSSEASSTDLLPSGRGEGVQPPDTMKDLLLHETENTMLHVTYSRGSIMQTSSVSVRVQKHRLGLRAAGLRPVQIWVPDTRREGFAQECRRQSLLLRNDQQETDTLNWLEAAADTVGWK
jgi:hypothetical protein